MAETNGREDSGSKDRATVALVDAKVDGLKDLIRAEFGFMRERIEPLAGAVRDVALLKSQYDDLERRVGEVEGRVKGDRDWKRINLPTIVLSAIATIGGIVALITQLP